MRTVAIIGAGKIGSAIAKLLNESGDYQVTIVDKDDTYLKLLEPLPRVNCIKADIQDPHKLNKAIQKTQAVVSACSYDVNGYIAEQALHSGVSYFDLTEDVATTHTIKHLAESAKPGQIFMPQCGLAPGFIGIMAYALSHKFEKIDTIKMRVGALPKFPSNRMLYNLTWSTDGLINEYCNLCEAISGGKRCELVALEGLEHISLDGSVYEAFNTSGGLGTLCETFDGKLRELNYKTIRYKGHQYLMQFLIRELQLGEGARRAMLKHILETSIPMTRQDVVLTFVAVKGWKNGVLEQITDVRKIYHKDIRGEAWSSIQLTTASSMCAILDLHFEEKLPKQGFVRQEDVEVQHFLENRFGQAYEVQQITSDV